MSTIADVTSAADSFRLAWKDGRPRVNVDYVRQTGDGECTFWVKLPQLSTALDIIDGVPETVTLSTSPLIEITRNVPLQHPYESLLYATGYSWEIYFSGAPEDAAIWNSGDMVKLVVRFGLPPFGLTGDPYQRVSVRGTESIEAVDGATFSGGDTPSFQPALILPGMSYAVTVFDAPAMDETHENFLRASSGKLNADVWRGNAIGTVRYHSPQIDYTKKRDGSRTATYSLQFDAKPRDWNYEMKRDGSLAALLVGGSNRFAYMDFNELFI